jgi:methyl-accepting chemotaxis protein/hemerythrin
MDMPWFVWNDSFAGGIQTFDEDHKRLFRLVNELHDSVDAGAQEGELRRALSELIRYTMRHFQAEETAMKGFSYPGLDEHHEQHEQLTQQVLAFVHQYGTGKATIGVSLLTFLQDWLTHHVLEADHRMSDFLRERGLT